MCSQHEPNILRLWRDWAGSGIVGGTALRQAQHDAVFLCLIAFLLAQCLWHRYMWWPDGARLLR